MVELKKEVLPATPCLLEGFRYDLREIDSTRWLQAPALHTSMSLFKCSGRTFTFSVPSTGVRFTLSVPEIKELLWVLNVVVNQGNSLLKHTERNSCTGEVDVPTWNMRTGHDNGWHQSFSISATGWTGSKLRKKRKDLSRAKSISSGQYQDLQWQYCKHVCRYIYIDIYIYILIYVYMHVCLYISHQMLRIIYLHPIINRNTL